MTVKSILRRRPRAKGKPSRKGRLRRRCEECGLGYLGGGGEPTLTEERASEIHRSSPRHLGRVAELDAERRGWARSDTFTMAIRGAGFEICRVASQVVVGGRRGSLTPRPPSESGSVLEEVPYARSEVVEAAAMVRMASLRWRPFAAGLRRALLRALVASPTMIPWLESQIILGAPRPADSWFLGIDPGVPLQLPQPGSPGRKTAPWR